MKPEEVKVNQHVYSKSLRRWGTTTKRRTALAASEPAKWTLKLDEPLSNIEFVLVEAEDLSLDGPQ